MASKVVATLLIRLWPYLISTALNRRILENLLCLIPECWWFGFSFAALNCFVRVIDKVFPIDLFCTECLWVAPELLRDPKLNKSKEGDIYSLGIVMKEIATREGPYDAESKYMELTGNIFIYISKYLLFFIELQKVYIAETGHLRGRHWMNGGCERC